MFLHFYKKTFLKHIHKKHQNYQKHKKTCFISCYKNIKNIFYIYKSNRQRMPKDPNDRLMGL